MINFLANLFRGLSFILGISAPPQDQDQRPFVFIWLGIIALFVILLPLLFYAIFHLSLS